jgi:hypothetical protein
MGSWQLGQPCDSTQHMQVAAASRHTASRSPCSSWCEVQHKAQDIQDVPEEQGGAQPASHLVRTIPQQ